MNAYDSPQDGFSQRMYEWMSAVEHEVRHAVDYVDRAVVPQVRQESGSALRLLAGHLEHLADMLHPAGKRGM